MKELEINKIRIEIFFKLWLGRVEEDWFEGKYLG